MAYILIYDAVFESFATRIAAEALIRAQPIEGFGPGDFSTMESLIFYADMQDLETVKSIRSRIGKASPAGRNWWFFLPSGTGRHAAQVQADALGATGYLSREKGIADLRRVLSVAGQSPVAAAQVASLRKSAGGSVILGAGAELADLFGGIAIGKSPAMRKVASIGVDINASVKAVGADEWLATVRNHHEGTFQHCLLVSGVVAGYVNRHIADPVDGQRLATAALLHDIGKAAVPQHVLDKPGRLTDAEFEAIKVHPGAGFDYLVQQPNMDAMVLDAVRHHHEALDGTGYPDRLTAEKISPMTRILTVCDIFAALVESRPYKPAKPPEEAVSILVKMAIENKVDYRAVRNLAQVFDMEPPATLAEVRANLLARQQRVAGMR